VLNPAARRLPRLVKIDSPSFHVSAGTGTAWSEAPEGNNGNPFVNTRFMSMSSFRFRLHLDQPQRLCMPRIGVLHLVKRRHLGSAGHSTRVAAARSQVSQQRSQPLNRQTIPCQVRLLLEAHRLRCSSGRRRVAPVAVHGQFLIPSAAFGRLAGSLVRIT